MGNMDTKNLLAVSADSVSADSLSAWRVSILDQAAMVIADPSQPQLQASIGVWDWGNKIPYPERSDITILPNGCMVFNAKAAEHVIHFSVWMVTGEIRVGVKIPATLVSAENIRSRVASAYDGAPCTRVATIGNSIMFDWIFKEGFAGFDTMVEGLRDPLIASVIATRIGEILTHIYLSVLSMLIDSNRFEVRLHKIDRPIKRVRRLAVVHGDIESFTEFARERGAMVSGNISFSDTGIAHIPLDTDESNSGIVPGQHRDVDGGMFVIRSVEPMKVAG